MVTSAEALAMGLISKVCPPAELDQSVSAVLEEISKCGPQATSQLIETMRGDLSSLPAALEREARCQAKNYKSAEFKEGLEAIVEKRSPAFSKP
jgi:enoyl-CoA hydratase/carnithine racemase